MIKTKKDITNLALALENLDYLTNEKSNVYKSHPNINYDEKTTKEIHLSVKAYVNTYVKPLLKELW